MTFKNSQEAFENAIVQGRLSKTKSALNYAGKFMYMGTDSTGKDRFKHIWTREYLK